MEDNDEKWGFMDPYWGTLSSHGVSLVPAPIHGSLRISLRGFHYAAYTKKSLGHLPRVRDALELVLLMALVDPVKFTQTALECIPIFKGEYTIGTYIPLYHPDAVIPYELRIRFYGYVLGYSESANPALVAKLLSQLLFPVDPAERATYQDARKRIYQVIASGHPHKQVEEIRLACERLAVPIEIDLSQSQVTTDMLLTLTQVRHTAEERNAASNSNCAFRMGQVSVRLDTRAMNVEQPMALMEDYTSSGILSLRDRNLLCDEHWVSTSTYAKALSALMISPGRGHAGSGTVARPPAKQHEFTLTWGDKNHKTALRPQSLCWLVHALFSSSARHSIRHVSLPLFTLSDAAIENVKLYAQCPNPMALLFDQVVWGPIDLKRECQRTPKQVVIAEGTSVWLSASRTRSRDVLQLDKSTTCAVLYESEDFVHIAAPGVGHCRVARSAVVSESLQLPVDTTADHRLVNPSLKSLTIVGSYLSRATRPHFHQLIGLVGRGLEQVTIESHDEDAMDLMDAILANCSLLQCTQLHQCNFPSFRYFLDAYENGKCKATSLEFMDTVATDFASVIAVLDALGDPATKISMALSELYFSLWRIKDLDDEVLSKAVQSMMTTNRTLRLLTVNVGQEQEFAAFLGSYHGQWIRGCGDPIPIRSKCAFLSVIYGTTSGNGNSPTAAMAQLDSGVLAMIFAMAANPVKRQVVVRR